MGEQHSLTLSIGVVALTLSTPSGWVALGVTAMVCATAVAVTAIKSSSEKA